MVLQIKMRNAHFDGSWIHANNNPWVRKEHKSTASAPAMSIVQPRSRVLIHQVSKRPVTPNVYVAGVGVSFEFEKLFDNGGGPYKLAVAQKKKISIPRGRQISL
jgi:hypothetical protein